MPGYQYPYIILFLNSPPQGTGLAVSINGGSDHPFQASMLRVDTVSTLRVFGRSGKALWFRPELASRSCILLHLSCVLLGSPP
jgi:hypothetical protein